MNRFSEMRNSLDCYRDKVDAIIKKFQEEKAKIESTYTPSAGEPLLAKNLIRAQEQFAVAQNGIIDRVNGIICDIQNQLKGWVSASPTNDKQFQLVTTLFSLGIALSVGEIESLQSSLGDNYFSHKIVAKLAEQSGVKGIRMPYRLDLYVGLLNNVKNEADVFISGYCGAKPVQELFTDKNTPVSKNLVYAAAVGRPFAPDSALLIAAAVWDGDGIPTKRKNRLTADDLDVLNQMFKGCTTPEQLSGRTTQILSQTPEMREILAISPYSAFVPKEDAVP